MVDRERMRNIKIRKTNNKRVNRVTGRGKKIPYKHMRQEELSHVKEAKGKRVKGRREDKVSPRMVGAGGE